MFDPAVWGTMGQWASAVGTTAAFTATFYVIRRDAKVRRYAQARKVAFYVDRVQRHPDEVEGKHKTWYDATIKNLSDEPIYDIRFFMLRSRRRVDGLGGQDVLLPEAAAVQRTAYGFTHEFVDVEFRDNSGTWWDRTLDGQLRERRRQHRFAVPSGDS